MKDEKDTFDFESAMARLEEISTALAKENAGLEESLVLYEEGIRLIRLCNERLEDAERRIQILKTTADGEIRAENFISDGEKGQE